MREPSIGLKPRISVEQKGLRLMPLTDNQILNVKGVLLSIGILARTESPNVETLTNILAKVRDGLTIIRFRNSSRSPTDYRCVRCGTGYYTPMEGEVGLRCTNSACGAEFRFDEYYDRVE